MREFCSTRMTRAFVAVDRHQAPGDLPHQLRRDAERGLVEQQQLRRAISARPIATICCSPPDRVPACWLPLLQPREAREDPVQVGRDPRLVGARVGAHQQVVLDDHVREDVAALGHHARCRAPRSRRPAAPVDPVAVEADSPRLDLPQPGDRAQGRWSCRRRSRRSARRSALRSSCERHAAATRVTLS